jgi:putative membrane protein
VLLLKEMGCWVNEAKTSGKIDSIQQASFDNNLNKLCAILTGCERIANTPIPYTYSIILHRTVYIYCLMLPFGFVDSLGWITPLVVTFIAYTFVALEALADQIEEPFGMEPNDLALDAISKTIENSLHEMNGEVLIKEDKPAGYFIS